MSANVLIKRAHALMLAEAPIKAQYPEYNKEWLQLFDDLQEYIRTHDIRWDLED